MVLVVESQRFFYAMSGVVNIFLLVLRAGLILLLGFLFALKHFFAIFLDNS